MSLGCGPTTRRNTEDQDTLGFAYHVLCLAICPHLCCVCVCLCVHMYVFVCIFIYEVRGFFINHISLFFFFFWQSLSLNLKLLDVPRLWLEKNLRILLSPPSRTVHRHESPHSVFIIISSSSIYYILLLVVVLVLLVLLFTWEPNF